MAARYARLAPRTQVAVARALGSLLVVGGFAAALALGA